MEKQVTAWAEKISRKFGNKWEFDCCLVFSLLQLKHTFIWKTFKCLPGDPCCSATLLFFNEVNMSGVMPLLPSEGTLLLSAPAPNSAILCMIYPGCIQVFSSFGLHGSFLTLLSCILQWAVLIWRNVEFILKIHWKTFIKVYMFWLLSLFTIGFPLRKAREDLKWSYSPHSAKHDQHHFGIQGNAPPPGSDFTDKDVTPRQHQRSSWNCLNLL